MVKADDHPTYVPILKWRKGEKVALKNLDTRQRKSIIPLIELVNYEGDNLSDLSRDIHTHWSETAYLDVHHRPKAFALNALDAISNHVDGLDIIPVARLDTPQILLEGIKNVALMYNNGIAIRIEVHENIDYELARKEIDLILKQLSVPINKCDLVIDFGYLSDTKSYKEIIDNVTEKIPLREWRRVVISAGVFPMDLGSFKPNEDNYLARSEWLLWLKYKHLFGREVIFSDYTVRGALYVQRGNPGSVSIRYTLEDRYQVFRGKQQDKSFKYLVHSFNIRTLYGDQYTNRYSWGDSVVHEKATQLEDCLSSGFDPETYEDFSPGNAADWVAASVNHHINVVLKSNLGIN